MKYIPNMAIKYLRLKKNGRKGNFCEMKLIGKVKSTPPPPPFNNTHLSITISKLLAFRT